MECTPPPLHAPCHEWHSTDHLSAKGGLEVQDIAVMSSWTVVHPADHHPVEHPSRRWGDRYAEVSCERRISRMGLRGTAVRTGYPARSIHR